VTALNGDIGVMAAPAASGLSRDQFVSMVEAEAAGFATASDLAALEANRPAWVLTLDRLLGETENAIAALTRSGSHSQVLDDFRAERDGLEQALARVTGRPELVTSRRAAPQVAPAPEPVADDEAELPEGLVGVVRLQATWSSGRIVAWAAGPGAEPEDHDGLRSRLGAAGAAGAGWAEHRAVPLPRGDNAPALAAPAGDVLGLLVAVGAEPGDEIGPTLAWLGRVALWAVELVAAGRMVPVLRQPTRGARSGRSTAGETPVAKGESTFSVRWEPALVDAVRLGVMARAMPAAVGLFDSDVAADAFTQRVLTGMVHAICRTAAARVEAPASSPHPTGLAETAEAVVAHFDGTRFPAPSNHGSALVGRLERWARPVTTPGTARLIVQLDEPSDAGAWLLSVHTAGLEDHPVPVEVALVTSRGPDKTLVEGHLARLERLLPVLKRPGGRRRGEVLLDQNEAWELMSATGEVVEAAGFEVRIPRLSRKRATPSLRIFAEEAQESVVGARQLAAVRWSAVFDDVELDASEIAKLAAQARPLVRSRGRWVALDHADLAAAAAALAERADTTRLSGAEMLRHALGLEGSPLEGGISVGGTGWAADLLSKAASLSSATRLEAPEGFAGTLRSYQADAISWLAFLDSAGLGGCLALDMGLGKTPTVLAHLVSTQGNGPALVIAPPAVVGNWASEAGRFAPGLRVVVHHGSDRAEGLEPADQAREADVILTTYGTAVRDVEELAAIDWSRVVVDEAQAIKNPASETARTLRRIPARSRIALTGTPVENGLGDLWAILDFANPGLVGSRSSFVQQLGRSGESGKVAAEDALRALNGLLVFRRTKAEPAIAAELPERVDQLDHCTMSPEQIGLYQAVIDDLVVDTTTGEEPPKGRVLAAITALKQICNHPAAYRDDGQPLVGRSGKLARLEEIVDAVFAADERVLIFTHFAQWGMKLADHLGARTGLAIACYHGGLPRGTRDRLIEEFQSGTGPGALVLSLKAGGTGLNLTSASHVVLYDRWWNPAVEDQARDRAWRIGQTRTVICHRLVCPGTIDERVEEVVAGKRRIADLVLPASSSLDDLDADQLRAALGLRPDALLDEDLPAASDTVGPDDEADETVAAEVAS